MATSVEWMTGYARQADADFRTFHKLQSLDIPECHRLQFLQMACEKLGKAHLCGSGSLPAVLQQSHAYVANSLPIVLRQQATFLNFGGAAGREVLRRAKHLAAELDVLAPAVKRGGQRPDNCEYPWVDAAGKLRVPIDWKFYPSQLLLEPAGRTFLKLVAGAIARLLDQD